MWSVLLVQVLPGPRLIFARNCPGSACSVRELFPVRAWQSDPAVFESGFRVVGAFGSSPAEPTLTRGPVRPVSQGRTRLFGAKELYLRASSAARGRRLDHRRTRAATPSIRDGRGLQEDRGLSTRLAEAELVAVGIFELRPPAGGNQSRFLCEVDPTIHEFRCSCLNVVAEEDHA